MGGSGSSQAGSSGAGDGSSGAGTPPRAMPGRATQRGGMIIGSTPPEARGPAPKVKDVTDATFEALVVERSRTVPVIIDLWAEWCQPCRQLGPILEKAVAAADGAVELAKVDIDKNPGVAQAFRVQSIPAVFAMVDGAVADGFVGVQNEAAVSDFVQRLVPAPALTELERLVAAGDEASLRAALEISSDDESAVVALAELLVGDGRASEAEALMQRIPENPQVRRLQALMRLQGSSEGFGHPGPGRDVEAELAELLPKVSGDDGARQRFVDLLELLGADDPRSALWRKRLSSALF